MGEPVKKTIEGEAYLCAGGYVGRDGIQAADEDPRPAP